MHMIRKGQFRMKGCEKMPFAEQFYALAGQLRPAQRQESLVNNNYASRLSMRQNQKYFFNGTWSVRK